METKKYSVILWPWIFLMLLLALTSCEKEEEEKHPPANLDLTGVDFISQHEATFSGDIYGDLEDVIEAGFCWNTTENPTISHNRIVSDIGEGLFSNRVDELESGEVYYVRAYYTWNDSVYYSGQKSFQPPENITDNQGHVYGVVQVGNQLWMQQNLQTTMFNKGDEIPDGTGVGNYTYMDQPLFYFNYEDDDSHVENYGRLYTWYVVTDERGVCPPGWRLPDILDWEELIFHLDALAVGYDELIEDDPSLSPEAGGLLKSTGTLEAGDGLWHEPNEGASNKTALNMHPSGWRDPSGAFDGMGYSASFWAFTENSSDKGIMFYTHFFNSGFYGNAFTKQTGYAVRCMKDIE